MHLIMDTLVSYCGTTAVNSPLQLFLHMFLLQLWAKVDIHAHECRGNLGFFFSQGEMIVDHISLTRIRCTSLNLFWIQVQINTYIHINLSGAEGSPIS